MKLCNYCHCENDDDALFCKKCAASFIEEVDKHKTNKKGKVKKRKSKKAKTKIKYRTKKVEEKRKSDLRQSHFFSHLAIFLLLIFILLLLAILSFFGYHYYKENNISVPDVVGYSYEEAISILTEANLDYQQKNILTKDDDEVGVVLKQNKRSGRKVKANTVITLTVGILDSRVEVPDVLGLSLEEASFLLNQTGIAYQVIYQESKKEPNTVIKQSIAAGKVVDATESITLTVSTSSEKEHSTDTTNQDDSDLNEGTKEEPASSVD